MPYSKSKKIGCPTCDGIAPKSCIRCYGKTKLSDWYYTKKGWGHISELKTDEIKRLGLAT